MEKVAKKEIIIRKETPADYAETEYMTLKAFWNLHGPGCNEHLLVHKVRESEIYLPELSRVAECDGKIVGTIMYTIATIFVEDKAATNVQSDDAAQTAVTTHNILTFGPLCVDPAYQDYGVGGKLLESTVQLAREAGYGAIIIFGEPGYYPKHGFLTCDHFGITTMDGQNFDAFMGIELIPDFLSDKKGKFTEGDVMDDLPDEETDQLSAELFQKYQTLPKVAMPSQWNYDNASVEKNGYTVVDAVQKKTEFTKLYMQYVEELRSFYPNRTFDMLSQENLSEEFDEYFEAAQKKPLVLLCPPTSNNDKKGEPVKSAETIELVPAGLAVVSGPGEEDLEDGCISYIEEMFLLPEYRGKGIATDFVSRFFRQQKGVVGFCVLKNNTKALQLWENLIQTEGYSYEKIDADDVWFFKVNCNRLEIKTGRLTIRPYSDRYLNDYYQEFTEEITHYQYPDPFGSKEDARKLVHEFCSYMEQGEMLELVILSKENEFLGSVEVMGLEEEHPELGIWLKKSAHGKGYAFEALKSLIEFLDKTYHKESYAYEADIRNEASTHLVEKFDSQKKDLTHIVTESGKELDLQMYMITNKIER